jgi:hypothetical protein
MATRVPDLEVDGEDKELVKTSRPSENISGKVKSFSGEVRSLTFTLSDAPEGGRTRPLCFDATDISLGGAFKTTLVYISDWNGDGVVDEWNKEEGIPNTLDVMALDVQGNWTYTTVPIGFRPSTKRDGYPELAILEIFPALDKDREAALPFGEEIRVRARAADDRGQPEQSGWVCQCLAEEPLINADRCPCELLRIGELNAGGDFPLDPWDWFVVEPASETRESFGVLRATEKVDEEADKTGLTNGDIVDPNGLILGATIYANVSELNRITALWNGEPRGAPIYDSETAAFVWDLQAFTVREGDRICVGATSMTGHATLYLLEFADTTDGLLLGVTGTSDTGECIQGP